MNKIKDMPRSERPYEKCFENGPETLSDCELLSVILRTGVKGSSAYDLAKEIITQQGDGTNLLKIMHTTKEELLHIKGVGMVKAVQILCIGELAKRIASMPFVDNVKYDSPKKIAGYYMERLRHLEQETLHVMFLDTKCKLIKSKEITKGTIDRSMISQREIFVEALKCNAVNIVLVHNHPSGNDRPSSHEITLTKKVQEAGRVLDITLLDHIVVCPDRYYSFADNVML